MSNVKVSERGGLSQKVQTAREKTFRRVSDIKRNGLEALNDISGIIASPLETQQMLSLVTEKTLEAMGTDAVLIFLLDENASELLLEAARGVSKEFKAAVKRMKVSGGFTGTVARKGTPLIVEDTTGSPLLENEGIKCHLVVPLKSEGKVIGTLCAARRTSGTFCQDEVAFLSSVGNTLGVALAYFVDVVIARAFPVDRVSA